MSNKYSLISNKKFDLITLGVNGKDTRIKVGSLNDGFILIKGLETVDEELANAWIADASYKCDMKAQTVWKKLKQH